MYMVIVLDLISVFLSILVFSLSHKLKSSFKSLLKPTISVFYIICILALSLAFLELTGFIVVDDTPFNVGLHIAILAIILLIVLSLNKIRVNQLTNELKASKELNKLKIEFLARTSHELKTPLTPLLMQLQMLQKGTFGKLDRKQLDSIGMIERNIRRLSALINDILYFSSSSSGKLKLNKSLENLNKLVFNAVKTMENKAKKKEIKILVKKETIPLIECDSDRITEILVNLIDNAVKFSPKGSQVLIETKQKNSSVLVSVKDGGIGITGENMSKLFESFTQFSNVTTRKYGGTGIGLSICKNLINLHNGKIWAESQGPGQGTTLYFTLPLKKSDRKVFK